MTELTYIDVRKLDSGDFGKTFACLPEERKKKAEAHLFERGRTLSAAAGYLLHRALIERGLENYKILYGDNGKPYLEGGGLYFNLSHGGDIAVCALSDCEVGVDVQKIAPVKEELLKRVCTESERQFINSAKEGREVAFCRLWTVKESFLKRIGAGLSVSLARLEVSFNGTVAVKLDCTAVNAYFKEYALDGYRIALCSDAADFPAALREITVI